MEINKDVTAKKQVETSILGLSTGELAGLSVDELTDNKTAITMIMHYYKQLVDENTGLKNEKNTLQTYVDAYKTNKSNSSTGAILLTLSNILIGFGVSLFASSNWVPGLMTFTPGIALVLTGMYFTFFKEK